MKGRISEGKSEREKEREIFHLLLHFLHGSNSLDQVRPEPAARNFVKLSHMCGRCSKHLGNFPLLLSGQ